MIIRDGPTTLLKPIDLRFKAILFFTDLHTYVRIRGTRMEHWLRKKEEHENSVDLDVFVGQTHG